MYTVTFTQVRLPCQRVQGSVILVDVARFLSTREGLYSVKPCMLVKSAYSDLILATLACRERKSPLFRPSYDKFVMFTHAGAPLGHKLPPLLIVHFDDQHGLAHFRDFSWPRMIDFLGNYIY